MSRKEDLLSYFRTISEELRIKEIIFSKFETEEGLGEALYREGRIFIRYKGAEGHEELALRMADTFWKSIAGN